MKSLSFILLILSCAVLFGSKIDPSQEQYLSNKRYQKTAKPPEQLVNTDKEPDLKKGFKPLFKNDSLKGWEPKGGNCTFEMADGILTGTCVPGSNGTFFSSPRKDFKNFIFTCEFKWVITCNSGVQFRSFVNDKNSVAGYQCEIDPSERGWTGGIYNQSLDGWKYSLWLTEHNAVRKKLKLDGWNRMTIKADGNVIKTWINGVGATHLVNDDLSEGLFAFQIHKDKQGKVQWRNIKIRELP